MAILSGRELKIYLFIVILVTVLSLVVTIVVMSVRRTDSRGYTSPEAEDMELTLDANWYQIEPDSEVFQNIQVPEEYTRLHEKEWKPFRPIHSKWTDIMVMPYWIDPRDLVEEELEKQSDNEIAEFFEGIP